MPCACELIGTVVWLGASALVAEIGMKVNSRELEER